MISFQVIKKSFCMSQEKLILGAPHAAHGEGGEAVSSRAKALDICKRQQKSDNHQTCDIVTSSQGDPGSILETSKHSKKTPQGQETSKHWILEFKMFFKISRI